ncbi:MAG: class I SAM-dependent methyltransferase [Candidatus Moranbacteria bacterium]|nr:class I SAM-dependent methyltransferase [Candidatus Moranbacteria bacterium]
MGKINQKNKLVEELRIIGSGFIDPETVAADWNIKKGEVVADLGCGGGYFTIPTARMVGDEGKVYAVDVMEGPIESVKSRAYLAGLSNIIAIRADLEGKESLSKWVKAGECDKVLLANVLYTSKKKNAIISEARRILKKKGNLIVVEWKKKIEEGQEKIKYFGPPEKTRISGKELKDMLKKSGFKFIRGFEAGNFHFGMVLEK